MMIGQHAKSNTDGHLAHRLSHGVEELAVNGVSIGEIGRNFLNAAHSGIPYIFLSGDAAACEEAKALAPKIETVAVKEAVKRGLAPHLSEEGYGKFNAAAIHFHPEKARRMIREGVQRAMARAKEIDSFWLEPPNELVQIMRPSVDGHPRRIARAHADDWLELLRQPMDYQPLTG